MIEAYDWLIAFQGSEGSDQSYCNTADSVWPW
jgi:hypothetical protein